MTLAGAEPYHAAFWLAVALASFAAFLRGGMTRFRWLYGDAPGRTRHRRFALRATRPVLHFALLTLLVLTALGRFDALVTLPPEFAAARHAASVFVGGALSFGMLAPAMAGGLLLGGTIAGLVERWRGKPVAFGNVEAVLPRTRGELGWGVLLSFTAGISEELFFRLLLPLLIALVSGSAAAGFVVATLLFGVAHRYQGWAGVAATTLTGALLAFGYLLTASLAAVIALHVAIDLNALVLRPILSGRLREQSRSGSGLLR